MFTMQVRGARAASMVVEDPFYREGPFQGKTCLCAAFPEA